MEVMDFRGVGGLGVRLGSSDFRARRNCVGMVLGLGS